MKEVYLSTQDVCNAYKVERHTIYRWMKKGMPYHKFSTREIRFLFSEVNAWVRKQTYDK